MCVPHSGAKDSEPRVVKSKNVSSGRSCHTLNSFSLVPFQGGKNMPPAGLDCSPYSNRGGFKYIPYSPQDIVQTTASQESLGCGGKQGRVAGEKFCCPMRLIYPLMQSLWSQKAGFKCS